MAWFLIVHRDHGKFPRIISLRIPFFFSFFFFEMEDFDPILPPILDLQWLSFTSTSWFPKISIMFPNLCYPQVLPIHRPSLTVEASHTAHIVPVLWEAPATGDVWLNYGFRVSMKITTIGGMMQLVNSCVELILSPKIVDGIWGDLQVPLSPFANSLVLLISIYFDNINSENQTMGVFPIYHVFIPSVI